jgi:copper homeostasis protein
MTVEVCAESIGSALTAQEAGAFRIEFCDNMAEGGTTPSAGQILQAREMLDIKLYPIIRPRGGDFCYSAEEFAVMLRDVEFCGKAGCDGVVIGILNPDGTVDMERCAELVAMAHSHGMGVTFHRAFDVSCDLERALEDIIALGCERVLTSGGAATALEGIEPLRELVRQAAGRITIMAGSGVTPENAPAIIAGTGVAEIHGTFRSRHDSPMSRPAWADYAVWHADFEKIKRVVNLMEN